MYSWVIGTHNVLRWVVIGAALWVLIRSLLGLRGESVWSSTDRRAGLIYTIVMDIQVLLGIALFAFLSPLTKAGFQDFQNAIASDEIRYFMIEHAPVMLVAWGLAHLGSVLVKRGLNDRAKFRRAAVWYGLSLIALLLATPWMRPLLPV